LLAQLSVNSAVVMSCLFVGVKHADAGLQEKSSEHGFVFRSLGAEREDNSLITEDTGDSLTTEDTGDTEFPTGI
jgi:hypothetical protein